MTQRFRSRQFLIPVAGIAAIFAIVVGLISGFFPRVVIAEPATNSRAKQDANTTLMPKGTVSLSHSRVYVRVNKSGVLGHEHGVEGRLKSGTLNLTGGSPFGELTFDMTSFAADTDAARKYVGLPGTTDAGTQSKVSANMRGENVLNVRQHPTARFAATGIAPLKTMSHRGLPQYRIEGNFTLCGRTQPVSFVADADQKSGWDHVRGAFSIQQTQFGITPFSLGFGAIGVADRLEIWGDLWIARQDLVLDRRAGTAVK